MYSLKQEGFSTTKYNTEEKKLGFDTNGGEEIGKKGKGASWEQKTQFCSPNIFFPYLLTYTPNRIKVKSNNLVFGSRNPFFFFSEFEFLTQM